MRVRWRQVGGADAKPYWHNFCIINYLLSSTSSWASSRTLDRVTIKKYSNTLARLCCIVPMPNWLVDLLMLESFVRVNFSFDYSPNYLYIHWNCVISLFLVEFCGEVWNKEFMLTDVCILEVLDSINTFLGKLPTKLIFIDFVLQNENIFLT